MKQSALLVVVSLWGCAATVVAPVHSEPSSAEVLALAPPPALPKPSPRAWVQRLRSARECELAVDDLARDEGKPVAWPYARACAERSDFVGLEWLIEHFGVELEHSARAPELLARVVANRGGHVSTDLALFQNSDAQVVDLDTALAQPKAFLGKYVLVLGRVSRIDQRRGRRELVVAEQAPASYTDSVFSERTAGTVSSSASVDTSAGDPGGRFTSSREGSRGTQVGAMEVRVSSEFVDTGRDVRVRLKSVDRSVPVDRPMVVLARFDGLLTPETAPPDSDDETRPLGVLTLVAHHEVSSSGVVGW